MEEAYMHINKWMKPIWKGFMLYETIFDYI